MSLMRKQETWDPLREMEALSNRLNRLFNLSRWSDGDREMLSLGDWAPSCNISETDKEYRIHAELPAVRKEDVHVTLTNGVLMIQGERREEREEKGVRFHRRELTHGHFLRRFTMPEDADEGSVDAAFRDGMLHVVIGKAKASASRSREILVH